VRWRTGGSLIQASWGKKLVRLHLNRAGMMVHAFSPSYSGGLGKKVAVLSWPQAKSGRSYPVQKITKAKRNRGMAQGKQEALSSNLSPSKKNKLDECYKSGSESLLYFIILLIVYILYYYFM
jgi:hypothetical protein